MSIFREWDIIAWTKFRIETVELGIPRSFILVSDDNAVEYKLNEYGNYIDKVYPEVEEEYCDLLEKLILAQMARRKAMK